MISITPPPLAKCLTRFDLPSALRATMDLSLRLALRLSLPLALSVALPGAASAQDQDAAVRLETYTATGAPGDAVLVKPVGTAGDVRAKAQSTAAATSFDPLRGLTVDPTREAVIGAADGARAGVRIRAREAPGGIGAKAAGQAGTTSTDVGRAADAPGDATSQDDATSRADTFSEGDTVSPVYVDAAGNARALPGGVIVTLRDGTDPTAARAAIEAGGHTVRRELGPGIWLVDTDSGEAAIEAARTLTANGTLRSVEPNWWREPVRK